MDPRNERGAYSPPRREDTASVIEPSCDVIVHCARVRTSRVHAQCVSVNISWRSQHVEIYRIRILAANRTVHARAIVVGSYRVKVGRHAIHTTKIPTHRANEARANGARTSKHVVIRSRRVCTAATRLAARPIVHIGTEIEFCEPRIGTTQDHCCNAGKQRGELMSTVRAVRLSYVRTHGPTALRCKADTFFKRVQETYSVGGS